MTDPEPRSTTTYCKKTRKRPYRKSTKVRSHQINTLALSDFLQGCKDCKIRKIKVSIYTTNQGFNIHVMLTRKQCDEKRPVCGNCTRRYIGLSHCEYVSSSKGSPGSSAELDTVSSFNRQQVLALPKSPTFTPTGLGSSNTLQLRLMYHYTVSTCGRHIISTVPMLPLSLVSVDSSAVPCSLLYGLSP